jgi:hypothetical protein
VESPDVPASDFFGSAPDEPESEPEPSAEDFESPADAAEPPSSFDLEARAVDRSFFAQPLPLKWTVGATNAFVIVPSAPHSGQNFGPWSLIP